MLHKTRGIVLKTIDYSESSVITQVFTEKFGLQSYIINGVKKPKAKIRLNMLQPLHLLDMVVYHKPAGNVQRVSELRQLPVFQSIPYDIIKSTQALFLNEVLYKSIKQQTADDVLFNYIFHSIELLDRMETGLTNFHLFFLLRLTQFLGFYPDRKVSTTADFFDLRNGIYTNYPPEHMYVLHQPHTSQWTALLESNFETLDQVKINTADRRFIVSKILDYYRLHIDSFGEIRSHLVLEEVLS